MGVQVSVPVGSSDQGIAVGAGIGSLSKGDIIRMDDELVKINQIGDTTFVQSRSALANSTVATNFYYDTKRVNSTVTRTDTTFATHDDNPPY